MLIIYIIAGVSVLLIILGFIALLTQKIYIDQKTQTHTEVDIPLFGRMRTNYPALVFVFLGCALSFLILQKFAVHKEKVDWLITGSMQNVSENQLDWREGSMDLFPCEIKESEFGEFGSFRIVAAIEKGKTFEDLIESIHFDHPDGASFVLFPRKEYEKYSKRLSGSLLDECTERTRLYKALPLEYK